MIRRAITIALLTVPLAASSQTFPSKPVRILLQFAPGGSGDVSLRTLAPHLTAELGQPIVIDNRPGGGGVVAAELLVRAPADGYTLMSGTSATQLIRPHLIKGTPFDPIKDFTPVTPLYTAVSLLVAHPSVPVNSMRELIDYAKKNPGKLSWGGAGIGTPDHLYGEQVKQMAGIDVVHVPYKASSLALNDVIAGQLPMTFTILAAATSHIKQGKLKPLGVVGDKATPLLPDVPGFGEVIPGYVQPPSWNGIFGPAGMPKPVLDRLHGAFVKALNQPDSVQRWRENGYQTLGLTPEQFAVRIRREFELVGQIIKAAGIKQE